MGGTSLSPRRRAWQLTNTRQTTPLARTSLRATLPPIVATHPIVPRLAKNLAPEPPPLPSPAVATQFWPTRSQTALQWVPPVVLNRFGIA
jgi:hypothetical protein